MFNFLKKFKSNKNNFENEELMNDLFNKLYKLNQHSKFTSKILMEYFLKAVENDETANDVFKVVYGGKEKVEKVNHLEKILNHKSVLHEKKYIHWSNRKTYTTKGIALPVQAVIFDVFKEVLHTEDEIKIPIYRYLNHMYHNYNDEVLVIYTDGEQTYARPYEMFFGLVEDEGIMKPRFKKIVE